MKISLQHMTIKNNRGETMITLEGFWSLILKVALALLVPITTYTFYFFWWVTTTIQGHTSELRDINTRMNYIGVVSRDNSNQLKENAGQNR